MAQTNYLIRLFGGRNLGVIFDNVAGTIAVAGQSLTLSTISTSLQAQFAAAIASGSGANPSVGTNHPSFGGDNVSAAVGAILDQTPTWRAAVAAAVANVTDGAASCQASGLK